MYVSATSLLRSGTPAPRCTIVCLNRSTAAPCLSLLPSLSISPSRMKVLDTRDTLPEAWRTCAQVYSCLYRVFHCSSKAVEPAVSLCPSLTHASLGHMCVTPGLCPGASAPRCEIACPGYSTAAPCLSLLPSLSLMNDSMEHKGHPSCALAHLRPGVQSLVQGISLLCHACPPCSPSVPHAYQSRTRVTPFLWPGAPAPRCTIACPGYSTAPTTLSSREGTQQSAPRHAHGWWCRRWWMLRRASGEHDGSAASLASPGPACGEATVTGRYCCIKAAFCSMF